MKKFAEFEKEAKKVNIFVVDSIQIKFFMIVENAKARCYPALTKKGYAWRCNSSEIKQIFSAEDSNNLFLLDQSAEKADKLITQRGYEKAFAEGYRGEY